MQFTIPVTGNKWGDYFTAAIITAPPNMYFLNWTSENSFSSIFLSSEFFGHRLYVPYNALKPSPLLPATANARNPNTYLRY